jgi:hypothetical protein
VGHLPVGRVANDVWVVFIERDPEQPIVIRRLLLGRDAEPFAVGIEDFFHGRSASEVKTGGGAAAGIGEAKILPHGSLNPAKGFTTDGEDDVKANPVTVAASRDRPRFRPIGELPKAGLTRNEFWRSAAIA